MGYKKTIQIDFDGVLNNYNGKFDATILPTPKEGLKNFLIELNKEFNIEILTARNKIQVILWLQRYNLLDYIVEVTNVKNPYASIFIDDRGLCFDGNYYNLLNKIKNFEPYWKEK